MSHFYVYQLLNATKYRNSLFVIVSLIRNWQETSKKVRYYVVIDSKSIWFLSQSLNKKRKIMSYTEIHVIYECNFQSKPKSWDFDILISHPVLCPCYVLRQLSSQILCGNTRIVDCRGPGDRKFPSPSSGCDCSSTQ